MPMEHPEHLQVYNTRPRQRWLTAFPLFSLLPQELRLNIWELALHHQRFLRVRLTPSDHTVAAANEADDRQACLISVEGPKKTPKFLRVCQESRVAALKFYRVQLPCRYELGGKIDHGTFYYNPELDILKVHPGDRKENFLHFAQDLSLKDPDSAGLLNLAVDLHAVSCLRGFKVDEMEPDTRHTLAQILRNIKEVYFLCLEAAGRMFLGPLNGVKAIQGWEMHRSRPIMGSVPDFEKLRPDPRPIEKDLGRVYLGTFDPRQMIFCWNELLTRCDVEVKSEDQRFLVSSSLKGHPIVDQESADECIRDEDARWRKGLDEWEQRLGKDKVQRETADELERSPKAAVGFWLFPVEALGQLPPGKEFVEDTMGHFKPKRVVDLSAYRPELGLLDLS